MTRRETLRMVAATAPASGRTAPVAAAVPQEV